MTKRIALVALLGSAVIVVGAGALILRPDSWTSRSTVASNVLGRDMPIEVFAPPGPHCASAPVLILFHGRGEDERQWMEGALFDGVGIDATARRLVEAEQLKPLTIVSASIDDSYGVDSAPANDGYDHGPYERYIVDELVPAVRERYGSGGLSPLYVGGLSMGGFAALNVAFRHPDMFAGIGALSPAFFIAPPSDREWIYSADGGSSLFDLAEASAAYGKHVFLGYGDHDYDWVQKATDQLKDTLNARGTEVGFDVVPGGHEASSWRPLSEAMLRQLFGTTPASFGCEL